MQNMLEPDSAVSLCGTAERPQAYRALRIEPLSFLYSEEGLRRITRCGTELVRAIAWPIRDRNRGTCAPTVIDETIEADGGSLTGRMIFAVAGGRLTCELPPEGSSRGETHANTTMTPVATLRNQSGGFYRAALDQGRRCRAIFSDPFRRLHRGHDFSASDRGRSAGDGHSRTEIWRRSRSDLQHGEIKERNDKKSRNQGQNKREEKIMTSRKSRRTVLAATATVAMLAAVLPAFSQSAAERAVEAAKQYAGTTLNVFYEAGLQPLDPKTFTGPMWEELTGIKINVIESPVDEMFTKTMQAHRAGSGAYDVLNVIPNQMPDLAVAGALEPLDEYVDKYGYREELQGIAPVYRDNQMMVEGKIYGFPDDGDVLVLYYRKDIFEDPETMAEFKAKFGYDLAAPDTWEQFAEIGQFITDKYAPEMYGAGLLRQPGNAQFMFQERFRIEGGKFFDPETMRASVNSAAGLKVFNDMVAENTWMPPGVEQWGFGEAFSAFLAGDIAMTVSWPPVGRWAAGYGKGTEALNWIPETQVIDKVGYALTPGGQPELAVGFSLSVASDSKNKEAAYLFIQWMNSEEISLQRVQLPFALRDPFRTSHFESVEYRSRWKDAGEYLDVLKKGAETGLLDLSLLQTDRYEEALRQGISRLWSGEDPQKILDDMAAQWDALTDRIGVEEQKRVYADWAGKPNAYPN